jgi:hypothetical protein
MLQPPIYQDTPPELAMNGRRASIRDFQVKPLSIDIDDMRSRRAI